MTVEGLLPRLLLGEARMMHADALGVTLRPHLKTCKSATDGRPLSSA